MAKNKNRFFNMLKIQESDTLKIIAVKLFFFLIIIGVVMYALFYLLYAFGPIAKTIVLTILFGLSAYFIYLEYLKPIFKTHGLGLKNKKKI
jgi:hypothetical protein